MSKDVAVGRVVGALAGITAWVGWLTICPALGFPTLATAAMFNRVLAPREDPGFWLGWAVLLIGLVAAALLYFVLAGMGRYRPSVASGALYGVLCWLVAGAVVMPRLGLAVPAPQSAAGTPPAAPDPMVGSFMMLHLGPAAPIAALVAWLLFGAVLGGTADLSHWARGTTDAERRRGLALAGGVAVASVVVSAALVIADLRAPPASSFVTSARTLATGPVEALPPGVDFVSIIDLIQAPGATLGPHAHVAGFAYGRRGVETIDFSDGTSVRVGPGEGGFMGTQSGHTHANADRLPAAILAILIVVAAVALCLTQIAPTRRAALPAPAALALLIAASAIGIWNPWSNDWLFLSVRPVSARGGAMPLPTSSRVYESRDLGALPPGPYVETLQEITLASGAERFEVGSTGVVVLLGLDRSVRLESADGTSQIGPGAAILVPTGSSVRISTAGDGPARVLSFGIAPIR